MVSICVYNRKYFVSQALETSLRAWEEKQRNALSAVTQSTSTISNASQYRAQLQICSRPPQLNDEEFSILLNFIEVVTTLVKWVKLLIISHPSLEPDLYQVASRTGNALEQVHPDGKILQGVSFNQKTLEIYHDNLLIFILFFYFFINR